MPVLTMRAVSGESVMTVLVAIRAPWSGEPDLPVRTRRAPLSGEPDLHVMTRRAALSLGDEW